MYKTETHLHVAEVSSCSQIGAEEMVRLYHEAGYRTVFVTDHLVRADFDAWGKLSWQEQIDKFYSGYELARAAGEHYGMNVIFSAELTPDHSYNDYLLYGIDKAFLEQRQEVYAQPIEAFYEEAKRCGIMVVQAHPLRDGMCTPTFHCVDAVEAYNPNPRHENNTAQVIKAASAYHLPLTAGSDTHRYEDVARTGILTEEEIKSAQDYIRVIRSGKYQIIGREEYQ